MEKPSPLIVQFTEALEEVVSKFSGMELTLAEALGAMELLKAQLIKEALENDENGDKF